MTRCAVPSGSDDVDRRDRRPAVAHAQLHLLVARRVDLLRRAVAVVEAPGAGSRRPARMPASADADAVVARAEIVFALAVALAGFEQPAGAVDAEALDHVARPAAAVALRVPAAARRRARRRRVAATWRRKSASLRNRRKRFFTSHSMRGVSGSAWATGAPVSASSAAMMPKGANLRIVRSVGSLTCRAIDSIPVAAEI